MTAGTLREKIRFQSRTNENDGYGNTKAEWTTAYDCRADLLWLRGGESVLAGRLEGVKTAVFTIRDCVDARAVTSEYRVVNLRTDEVFNVRSVNSATKRGYIDILAETGVADG